MSAGFWILSAALVVTGPDGGDSSGRSTAGQVNVDGVQVTLIDEVEVAAEEAGLLTELTVREGDEVHERDQIAQINDSKVVAARKVAEAERAAAQAEADSTVSIQYAKKAAGVAEYDFKAHDEANRQQPKSVAAAELKKLLLQWHKGVLEIEKAELEKYVAELTAKVKAASVEAADVDIRRRKVMAPLDAVVTVVYRHVGEWVNPGDAIIRLVRMNKVSVEGTLRIAYVSPTQVVGRPVTVTATLTGGQVAEFKGKVVFVNPELVTDEAFTVVAEVENREENGAWLLLPRMAPHMTIDLGRSERADRRK
jgi:multidrug efflux pump subunit AcrA (membrane-fusion protein)